ncbi:MAG: AAA family ATPase, partial [Bdellovibrionales bacterium]|nr:AAA family ATPase [Bdellovibrionales bacterium]
ALPTFKDLLAFPFAKLGNKGTRAIAAAMGSEDLEVAAELCRLLSAPCFYSKANDSWIYPVEITEQHAFYRWAVEQYMDSSDPLLTEVTRLISTSPLMNEAILGIAKEAKRFLNAKDFEGLGLFIGGQIEAIKASPSLPRIIGFVSLCSYLADHPEAKKELKLKIQNIQDLKDLTSLINRESKEIKATYSTLAAGTVRAFTSSLDDFYLGKDQRKLEECLDNFQMIIDDPDVLKGIDGTKIRQGAAIVGEPGVGKTHLVELIANQFGLKKFLVSPWSKKQGEEIVDMVNRIFNEARDFSKTAPCMLFFDEAEAIMPERDNPRATQEMHDRTDHVLQIIDDVRKNYPKILPVVVSNFEHKLDEAALRRGRIDFIIRREKPNSELRRKIIQDTLGDEGLTHFTSEQVDELVSLSEGLLVLPIMTPIYESSRILSRLKVSSKGKSAAVDFDTLKNLYHEAQEEFKADEQRRQEKRKTHYPYDFRAE